MNPSSAMIFVSAILGRSSSLFSACLMASLFEPHEATRNMPKATIAFLSFCMGFSLLDLERLDGSSKLDLVKAQQEQGRTRPPRVAQIRVLHRPQARVAYCRRKRFWERQSCFRCRRKINNSLSDSVCDGSDCRPIP